MGDLYLPESGTKVNGMEQPFHPRGVYCLICLMELLIHFLLGFLSNLQW